MKVFVTRTSDMRNKSCEVREYDDLDDCVQDLISKEKNGSMFRGIIIYEPDDYDPVQAKKCKYVAEIYDDWRE